LFAYQSSAPTPRSEQSVTAIAYSPRVSFRIIEFRESLELWAVSVRNSSIFAKMDHELLTQLIQIFAIGMASVQSLDCRGRVTNESLTIND
jgi:hypothetical protein